jgi:hypothetical protein
MTAAKVNWRARRHETVHIRRFLGIAVLAAPLFAHHSFTSVFDQNKPVTLKGVVTRIDWMNPHTYVYIDVKDDKGNVVNWGCESGPPGMLTRNGWKRDTLKSGDELTVDGYRAKDGSNLMNARQIATSDGRKIFAGTSADQTGKDDSK